MLSLPNITVSTLTQYINTSLHTSIAESLCDATTLRVCGTLGAIPKTTFPTYYGVKLTNNGVSVLMDVPRLLIQNKHLCGGEDVTVTGVVTAKINQQTGGVDIRLAVSDVSVNRTNEAMTRTNDLATITALKQAGMRRNAFPIALKPRMTVISSKSSNAQVDNDFFHELGNVTKRLEITHVRVNILSAEEITNAIRGAECDILVLIRGGGDSDQFMVFDNAELVAEFSKHTAYRIVGLGHTGNSTILDFASDFCANTPTQAGGHIRERYIHQFQVAEQVLVQNKLLATQLEERNALIRSITSEAQSNRLFMNRVSWGHVAWMSFALGLIFAVISR